MIDEDEVDLKEDTRYITRYIKKSMQSLPLLGAADSETGRVITHWRVMGGVKFIPRRTTYHRTSFPGFWVDGNKYILVQFLVGRISSLQVVDNVISSTRSTGPLHHSSQLLFMITLFNQLWSVVIITNNSTNFLIERWKQEWSVHIQELWLAFCNSENLYYFPAHCTVSFSLIRAIKITANDAHLKRLWRCTRYNWACSNLIFWILEIVLILM